jgi:hypothetical protein
MERKKLTDREIEEEYESGKFHLSLERNDFFLPQVVDFVRNRRWMNLSPEYQRRLVWDRKKKSLLIESLLMNVPVPPVFLYEYELNRYEVMDGQQRLNTIIEFYDNRLTLSGLTTWTSLNGKIYNECPPKIQSGLDRRRMSATTILAESSVAQKEKDIRRIVFERLNTGGVKLNAQEIRNCLYSGPFNDLIIELAGNRLFNEIWDIPPYEDNIRGKHISNTLMENGLYKRMGDCEIVLRFFALRRRSKVRGAIKQILDNCMIDYQNADETIIGELEKRFLAALKAAHSIFGEETFRIVLGDKKGKLSQSLYDAVMVALDKQYENQHTLANKSAEIRSKLREILTDQEAYESITGGPNTADAIKQRQVKLEEIFNEFI